MYPNKAVIRNLLLATTITFSSFSAVPAFSEEVYMIRGFMNVFSRGMDQMTRRLKASGVRARVIANGDWQGLAQNIISRARRGKVSYPIVIVGHSLGGVEAPKFANALAKGGVKVGLVIGLDPGFANPNPFGPNVAQVVNYKIPSGNNYRRGRGFNGRLQNITINGVDHVGIDKNARVQRLVIARIRKFIGK
ncbi:MAG: hypothetical protein L3J32_08275 [Rhizobiaceae bacterium]|nr:hypothetical protein [Rhizobiaceae bacterium]